MPGATGVSFDSAYRLGGLFVELPIWNSSPRRGMAELQSVQTASDDMQSLSNDKISNSFSIFRAEVNLGSIELQRKLQLN